jgi:putative ABC transport system permease protein
MSKSPQAVRARSNTSRPVGAERLWAPRRGNPTQVHARRNTVSANLSSAVEALWANRLRSLLTALGVIVGVAAVIGAVMLTQGTGALINQRVAGLGTNTLTIIPGAVSTGGVRSAAGATQSLTEADATAITAVPHVTGVSPIITVNAQLVFGNQNWNSRVQGVYPAFQQIGNWTLAEGSWFGDTDESSGQPVAVLGDTTQANLFGASSVDPVGQTIFVNGQAFRVVGLLKQKGATAGGNQDDVVYVPFSTAATRLRNTQFVSQIQAQVNNANNVSGAQTAITSLLEQRHNLPSGGPDDFTVFSSNQLVSTAQTFTNTLTVLLVGVAAISLIVGGIGIMNIMLVSVTERTREIGIRMAIGARRRDIRNQFLIEALALSVLGGVLGIACGALLGVALTHAYTLPLVFNPLPMLLAFGVSAGIGVGFGLYPAIRASRLDPIVALRAE